MTRFFFLFFSTFQLFWERKLSGLNAFDIAEELVKTMELPRGLQGEVNLKIRQPCVNQSCIFLFFSPSCFLRFDSCFCFPVCLGVGPASSDKLLLSALASALHTSPAPVTGQLTAAVEKNPGVWLNTSQPLCKAFVVTDDDIRWDAHNGFLSFPPLVPVSCEWECFLSGFSSVSLVKCQLKCTLNERREVKMIHFQWYSSKTDPYIKNQMGGFTLFQCRIMVLHQYISCPTSSLFRKSVNMRFGNGGPVGKSWSRRINFIGPILCLMCFKQANQINETCG